MKAKPYLITVIIVTMALNGCVKPNPVSLSNDREENVEILAGLIPRGTSIAPAKKTMLANGFDWVIHRDQSVTINKGDQIIGSTKPMTFAVCTRIIDDIIWQAIIIINDNGLVEDVEVTSNSKSN